MIDTKQIAENYSLAKDLEAPAADCGLRKMLFVIDNDGLNNLTSRKLYGQALF